MDQTLPCEASGHGLNSCFCRWALEGVERGVAELKSPRRYCLHCIVDNVLTWLVLTKKNYCTDKILYIVAQVLNVCGPTPVLPSKLGLEHDALPASSQNATVVVALL